MEIKQLIVERVCNPRTENEFPKLSWTFFQLLVDDVSTRDLTDTSEPGIYA
jgi:hypothetical protein